MADLELPVAALWNNRRGELLCEDGSYKLLFAIEPRGGVMVTMLPGSAATAQEGTLCIPEDGYDSLQMQVLIVPFQEDEAGAAADRFTAYHGTGHRGTWCRLEPIGGKIAGVVLDPSDMPLMHSLAEVEGRLLKLLNADRARLSAVVNARLGAELHEILAVGIDPRGIDVRCREGVRRLTFVKFAEDVAVAEGRIRDLLG